MSATQVASSTFQNAHRRHVQSLYKRSLKLSLDWYIQRDLWRQKALDIRAQFEANKHVTNPKELQALVAQAEKTLQEWEHPDPYKCTDNTFLWHSLSVSLTHSFVYYRYYYSCYCSVLGSRGYQVGAQHPAAHGMLLCTLSPVMRPLTRLFIQ